MRLRNFRVHDEDWDAFTLAVQAKGLRVADVLREFVAGYAEDESKVKGGVTQVKSRFSSGPVSLVREYEEPVFDYEG